MGMCKDCQWFYGPLKISVTNENTGVTKPGDECGECHFNSAPFPVVFEDDSCSQNGGSPTTIDLAQNRPTIKRIPAGKRSR